MITERQLARRSEYIGGSDLPAIMGFDPWRNAADVFAEKVYGTIHATNDAMEMGNVLEPAVAELAEKHLGKLRAVGTERRIKDTPCLLHVDRIVTATRDPVEIKTSGILHPFAADKDAWGDEGTDQIPERVIIQCHGHMAATDRATCHVATLLGGRGFVLFRVNFDAELWAHILSKATAFWVENVEARVPPADCIPSMDTIKRLKRLPGKTIEATSEIIEAWEARAVASAARLAAEKVEKEADRVFAAMLDDAEAVEMPDGRTITYMIEGRDDPDREKMKADGIWEQYSYRNEWRRIREKKAKGK